MRKLLVIERDAEAQQSYRRIFDCPGLQVSAVHNLAEAISLLPALKPEVILMNPSQHDDSVLEGLRRLREHDRRLLVVVIASARGIQIATEAIRLGAFDYLSQPFDIPKLQEIQVLTRAALSTGGRAKSKFLPVPACSNSRLFARRRVPGTSRPLSRTPPSRMTLDLVE